MSLIDHALLDELAELLGPQLSAILATYRAQVATYHAELTQALDAGDLDAVRRAAHGLKGASASVGATALHDAMQHIEHAARDGDAARAHEGLAALPAVLEATLAALPGGA
jgi:HPt (histidine-containing phosphotransfer) domain-containing protein